MYQLECKHNRCMFPSMIFASTCPCILNVEPFTDLSSIFRSESDLVVLISFLVFNIKQLAPVSNKKSNSSHVLLLNFNFRPASVWIYTAHCMDWILLWLLSVKRFSFPDFYSVQLLQLNFSPFLIYVLGKCPFLPHQKQIISLSFSRFSFSCDLLRGLSLWNICY